MLSLKLIGGSWQVNYYVSLGKEDYYTGEAEPRGRWWGRGATALGLSGQVTGEVLKNLLEGVSPDGETKLVQNARCPNRLAAIDLTFSVPKSVSIVWSQAESKQRQLIETACETALYRTLAVFAEQCGVTRRGHLGSRVEKADLIGAVFPHETARGLPDSVPDPNLHWHVLILNAVVRRDGTTGSFDARKLFARDAKLMLGSLFRAELSSLLQTLGLTSHRPQRDNNRGPVSWFELEIVPAEFVRAMSKRRQQIEAWLTKHGVSGAKMAEKAAQATRRAKEHFRRKELFAEWRKLGREYGLTAAEIAKAFDTGPQLHNRLVESKAAINRAFDRITGERAHFTETELLRFTAEEAQTRGIGIADILPAVAQTLKHDTEIIQLQDYRGERNYTTRQMLDTERELFALAKAAQDDASHSVPPAAVTSVLHEYETLRQEQIGAIRYLTTKNASVTCLNGIAGAGKTHALGVCREIWQRQGLTTLGTALAATAAKELENGSGIASTHLHKLLADLECGKQQLTSKHVLVVDECGLLGTKQLWTIAKSARSAGAKLILVGDYRQLQPIEAGGAFAGLARHVGCFQMKEIVRQRERWARKSVVDLVAGNAQQALQRYAERGLLRISSSRDAAMERLVADWAKLALKDLQNTLIVVGTNLERVAINRLCQRERRLAGELGEETIAVGESELSVGDRVRFTRNNALLLVRNGTLGTVVGIDSERSELQILRDDALGVTINIGTYPHLYAAYASTAHSCQGRSVERAFVLAGGPMTDREIAYVQGSRAKGITYFYTDVISDGETVESLARQMSRSRPKELAHDFVTSF